MKSSRNKRNNVPETSASKTDTYWLLGIIALAACVRIVFALQTTDDPFRGLLFLDSRVYHLLAAEIANSNFWGSEVFFRAPLFPYILAITYKLFGLESAAIQVFHALLGIGTVVLTYLIANIHFGRRVARIAGICTALYPTLYFFELSLMPTALEVFTFTAAVYCLSRYQKNRTNVALAIAGIVLGLAALSRPTILSFVLVLPLWLWLLERKQNWKSIATKMIWVVVPMAIVILPVTIRNYMIEPDLVMISSQGGANFFIGNNQNADGQTVSFPFGQTPLNRYEDHIWSASQFIAKSKLRRELTSAEVSDYWFDQGMQFVTSHPADAIGLFRKKVVLLILRRRAIQQHQSTGASGVLTALRTLYLAKRDQLSIWYCSPALSGWLSDATNTTRQALVTIILRCIPSRNYRALFRKFAVSTAISTDHDYNRGILRH